MQQPAVAFVAAIPLCRKHVDLVRDIAREAGIIGFAMLGMACGREPTISAPRPCQRTITPIPIVTPQGDTVVTSYVITSSCPPKRPP